MAKLVLFNKPFKVLSQFTSEGSDKSTLADHLSIPGIYAAGRLDYDSEGLLLLTDNGQLQHRIADPKHKSPKTYWVQVEGLPSESDLDLLRSGITLKDGPTKPAKVSIIAEPNIWQRNPPIRQRANIPTTWLEIIITEGRNRQVRRMTAAINHPTLRLVRAQIGDWLLADLQPGEYKEVEVADPPPNQASKNNGTKHPRNNKSRKSPAKHAYSKGTKFDKMRPTKSR